MAIYHFSAQVIGRSSGRSSVAAAAYRSGEKMYDERLGFTYDYTRKLGVEYTEIIAPNNIPEWATNRSKLWNAVEAAEKRKDAQLAREINIALPKELSKELQIELTKEFVKDNFVNRGMIADITIHDNFKGNPHAHVMLTTRDININGFGNKNRSWNDKELLEQWRKAWAEYVNKALEKENYKERIDHRTLEAQGIERKSQIHVGPHANAMEKRGLNTDRGSINKEIVEVNKRLQEIKNEKVILLNEYKSIKEEQRKTNSFFKQFNQEEREAITKAQSILKKYVSLENIETCNKQLDKNVAFWDGVNEKLTKKMKNLEEANFILSELKQLREQYKNAAIFSQERKDIKEKLNQVEDKFKNKIEYIERYNNFGIHDEQSFENIYKELKAEELKKRDKYASFKNEIFSKKEILSNAEIILKEAECKKLIKDYRDFEEYKNIINSEDARHINKINNAAGVTLSFEDIKNLGEKSYKIIQEKDRLERAEKYIKEYENLKELSSKQDNVIGQVKRAFNSKQEQKYRELREKINITKTNLDNCKVSSQEDLNNQKEILIKEINSLPQWCKDYGTKVKGKELNNNLYQIYRQERKYETANDIYKEIQQLRDNMKNKSLLSSENKTIKEQIRQNEEKFIKLRVGSIEDFEKNYAIAKAEIENKKYIIEDQKKQLAKVVDISELCNISIRARNAAVELHNKKYINDYYKKQNIGRVVNGNEFRGRGDEGSYRRDQETDRGTRTISASGNRHLESSPAEFGRHNEGIQRTNPDEQRTVNRVLQQDGGGSQCVDKNDRREVLETTTGGIKEGYRYDKKQQIRDNIGAETNDRKISTQDRNAIISKDNNSPFRSRFKSRFSNSISNSASRFKLDNELKKQIEDQKHEITKIEKEKVKDKEKDYPRKIKSKEMER